MIYNIFVWALWFVISITLSSSAAIAGLLDPSGRAAHNCARLWAKAFIFTSGVKVEITGAENIIKGGSQIFISNHQGFFDIFSITALFPIQLRWIAKKSLFDIPFIGWAMRGARYISIDRDNKRSAIRSIQHSLKVLNEGYSVVIFPEGTRTEDGKLLPFKRGSLILINKATAPIVPITISGSYKIIKPNQMRINRGTIRIKIDKPIYTENMTKEDKSGLLEQIKGNIQKNLDELDAQEASTQKLTA